MQFRCKKIVNGFELFLRKAITFEITNFFYIAIFLHRIKLPIEGSGVVKWSPYLPTLPEAGSWIPGKQFFQNRTDKNNSLNPL